MHFEQGQKIFAEDYNQISERLNYYGAQSSRSMLHRSTGNQVLLEQSRMEQFYVQPSDDELVPWKIKSSYDGLSSFEVKVFNPIVRIAEYGKNLSGEWIGQKKMKNVTLSSIDGLVSADSEYWWNIETSISGLALSNVVSACNIEAHLHWNSVSSEEDLSGWQLWVGLSSNDPYDLSSIDQSQDWKFTVGSIVSGDLCCQTTYGQVVIPNVLEGSSEKRPFDLVRGEDVLSVVDCCMMKGHNFLSVADHYVQYGKGSIVASVPTSGKSMNILLNTSLQFPVKNNDKGTTVIPLYKVGDHGGIECDYRMMFSIPMSLKAVSAEI